MQRQEESRLTRSQREGGTQRPATSAILSLQQYHTPSDRLRYAMTQVALVAGEMHAHDVKLLARDAAGYEEGMQLADEVGALIKQVYALRARIVAWEWEQAS